VKRCRKCGETKPLEEFVKDKRCRDGRTARCKECFNADQRQRYVDNNWRETVYKRYEDTNRDRIRAGNRERTRRWRERNPEAALEKSREGSRQLRQRKPDYFRQWYQRNRESEIARVQQRRAVINGGEADREFITALLAQPCAYCGATSNITVDHIVPLIRGGKHEPANLAPACATCNLSKGAKPIDDWLAARRAA
jgi:5-methylcytosine-specific restriction endonuclease McrA